MKRIWMAESDGGVGFYRACQPVNFCKMDDISLTLSKELRKDDYDAVIFPCRLAAIQWVEVIDVLKRDGVRIALELDDDYWNIPDHNPAARKYGQIERDTLSYVCDEVDLIITSTQPLKEVVLEHLSKPVDKIRVCPNLLDSTLYPQPSYDRTGPIKILWAGSVHHEKDLEEIVAPLERIMTEYWDRVQVFFFGTMPYKLCDYAPIQGTNMAHMIPTNRFGSTLGYIRPVDIEHYPSALCNIAPDIALCPLTSEKFNESKSIIKAAECALAGAAIIASTMPPYEQMGDNALYVEPGDAEGWYNKIKFLIDKPLALRAGQRLGREHVLKNHCWQSVNNKLPWLLTFRELVSHGLKAEMPGVA